MAVSSELIQKDKKKRNLGNKFYTDEDWIYETDYQSSSFTTSNESYVDVDDSSITLFLEKTTTVLILVTAYVQTGGGAGAIGNLALDVDGDIISPTIEGTDSPGEPLTGTIHIVTSLSAGSHTFKLRLKSAVPSQVSVSFRRLSVIKLVE